jgi:hypothetical protein
VGRFPRILPDLWFNYVQNTQPDPPDGLEEGEMWYEPDSNTSYVYDGASWIEMTITAHSQLSGISGNDHHNPVTTSDPLTVDAGQTLGLSLGTYLTLTNGSLDLADGAANSPDWTEDPNSPHTLTGSSNYTITLADSYDDVRFVVKQDDIISANEDLYIRLNGFDGDNYTQRNQDGTSTSGLTRINAGKIYDFDLMAPALKFEVDGRVEEIMTYMGKPRLPDAGAAVSAKARTGNLYDTLNSVELYTSGGTAVDMIVEVFGRDFG